MNFRIARIAAALMLVAAPNLFGAEMAKYDHVHLIVPADETLAAAQWYGKYFGGEVTKSGSFDVIYYGDEILKFKGAKTDIKPGAGSSVDHIGFSVEDVAAKLKEFEEAGEKIVGELKHSRRGDFDYAYVEDPWGTKVEIINDAEISGLHHVHISSTDPEAALGWYASVFGGEISHFKGIPGLPVIRYGDILLLAMKVDEERPGTEGYSVDHLGWNIQDMEAFVANAKEHDVEFLSVPAKHKTNIGGFVASPSGIKIEIQQHFETE